jgi:hypothetical protein
MAGGSENPRGAVNQQERPDCKSGILRDLTPGFKEAALSKMIKSDLHGDMQEVLRKGKTPLTRCKCALCNKMNGPKVAKFLVG